MERRHRAPGAVLTLLCATAVVLPAPASAAGCANETLQPDATNVVEVRAATRCLINQQRVRFGRKPLASSGPLVSVAQGYSEKMVRERFFDHVAPDGSTVLTKIRSTTSYLRRTAGFGVGDNLAWGSWELANPLETVNGWMQSPGHRHNILYKRFRHIGIGVATGAPESVEGPAATYTTVFAHRKPR